MLGFEWDPVKSRKNKERHGISFSEALEIWQGPHITVDGIAKSKDGERRNATLGFVRGELFVGIWTKRGQVIRLISVRRASDGEKKVFISKI